MQNLLRRLEFQSWYFRHPPWDTGVSPPELLEFIQEHGPGRAIDIGCGTGTNVITLARAGWSVTGIDFAPRAIKIARRKARQAGVNVELLVIDATMLHGIDGPFDLALDLGCFHGIPAAGQRNYLEQLKRVLAPNGFWLLYAFLRSPGQDVTGVAEADIDQIARQLNMLSRREGMDTGRARASAWFLFQAG